MDLLDSETGGIAVLNKNLPRIPIASFTVELFFNVLRVYWGVAVPEMDFPESSHDYFGAAHTALSRDGQCEFRFGSKVGRHTKLVLYTAPSRKGSGLDVVIDIDPNTSDDESAQATSLRNNFWVDVGKLVV